MSASRETILGMLRGNNPTAVESEQLENALRVFAKHSTELQKRQSVLRLLTQTGTGVGGGTAARFFCPSAVVGPLYATVAVVVAGTLSSYCGAKGYDAITARPRENWTALNAAIEKLLNDSFSIAEIIDFIEQVNNELMSQLENEATRSAVKAIATGVYPAVLGPHQPPLSIAIHATSANAFPLAKFFVPDAQNTNDVISAKDQGLRQRRVPR